MSNNLRSSIINWENCINNKTFSLAMLKDLSDEDFRKVIGESSIINGYFEVIMSKENTLEKIIDAYNEEDSLVLIRYAELQAINTKVDNQTSGMSAYDLFFSDLKQMPILSREETIKYIELCQYHNNVTKDEVKMCYYRDKVLIGNLHLVAFVANRYAHLGLDLLDLIQEGSLGLMRAIMHYDLSLNTSFSTYAYVAIQRKMKNAIDANSSLIVKSPNYVKVLNAIREERSKMLLVLGRFPTNMELANALGLSEEKIKTVLSYDNDVLSLDRKVYEDDDITLQDIIEDKDTLTPEEALFQKVDKEIVKEMLSVLDDREKMIIMSRFGFKGEIKSIEQVAKSLGVSSTRVHQIQNKAFKKMKRCVSKKVKLPNLNTKCKEGKEEYEGVYLKEILELTEEEFRKFKITRRDDLLMKIFGNDLEDPADFTHVSLSSRLMFYGFVSNFKNKNKFRKCPLKGKTIAKITGINSIYVLKYYRSLNMKKKELLVKYFGVALNKVFAEDIFVDSEVSILIGIIDDLIRTYDKHLACVKEQWSGKSLKDILKCDADTTYWVLNLFAKDSHYYSILVKTFGFKGFNLCNFALLSYDAIELLDDAIRICEEQIAIKNNKNIIDEKNIKIVADKLLEESSSVNRYFKEAIGLLPKNIRMILELKTGVYDSKIHSISEIAQMFNTSVQEVNSALDSGMAILDMLIDTYKAKYKDARLITKDDALVRAKS